MWLFTICYWWSETQGQGQVDIFRMYIYISAREETWSTNIFQFSCQVKIQTAVYIKTDGCALKYNSITSTILIHTYIRHRQSIFSNNHKKLENLRINFISIITLQPRLVPIGFNINICMCHCDICMSILLSGFFNPQICFTQSFWCWWESALELGCQVLKESLESQLSS